jgi:predicted DNA-binding transcriptional regulator AlpA
LKVVSSKHPEDDAMTTKPYLSDKDLAERFGVTRTTVWRWTAEGLLPEPVKIGPNTTRWRLADVQAFEAMRAQEAAADPAPRRG